MWSGKLSLLVKDWHCRTSTPELDPPVIGPDESWPGTKKRAKFHCGTSFAIRGTHYTYAEQNRAVIYLFRDLS